MADAPDGSPEIILIASGSEVALVIQAHETLTAQGIRSRVVSMPSWDIFEQQPQSYRDAVLPAAVTARLAVEQGSVLGWDRYVGAAGRVIGMKTFGASAPLKELQQKFGFRAGTSRLCRHGVARPQLTQRSIGRANGRRRSNGKRTSMLDKPDSSARSKANQQTASATVAPPCAMVIFGAAGDLTKRLVVPALYNLQRPPAVRRISSGRRRPHRHERGAMARAALRDA